LALPAPLTEANVAAVLFRRQYILQNGLQLALAPGAAILDRRQQPLEIADSGRQNLHLAQSALYRLQTLAHEAKRFAQALFEGGVQFLVHRPAHGVQLFVVGLAHVAQSVFGATHQIFERRARMSRIFPAESDPVVDAPPLLLAHEVQGTGQRLADLRLHGQHLRAQSPRVPFRFFAGQTQFIAQGAIQPCSPVARNPQQQRHHAA